MAGLRHCNWFESIPNGHLLHLFDSFANPTGIDLAYHSIAYICWSRNCSAFHASTRAEARKFFVGGNWKCNGSVSQVNDLISMINQSTLSTDTEVVVCPSQVYVQGVQEKLRGDVAVGAQDCWVQGNGAFTGETSADMLADMGVGWVIIGHSERRGKGEADAEVAAKAKYALDKGLKVIACCGEPLENREAGTTNDFVFPQIEAYANVFTKEDWKNVVIACEYYLKLY